MKIEQRKAIKKTLRNSTSSDITLNARHRQPGSPGPKMTTDYCIVIQDQEPQIECAEFDYRQTDVKANLRK
ncbi:Uncharacterized protein FWK35_00033022, partial [Aphis craccivora]